TRTGPGTGPWKGREATDPASFSPGQGLTLVAAAVLAVLCSRTLEAAVRDLLLTATLTLLYFWSVGLFYRVYRRAGELGVWLLAMVLAVYATEQLHHAVMQGMIWWTGWAPAYANYLRFGDFLLETLTAVAMILVFLNEDQRTLRDTLNRLAESEEHLRLVFEHSGVG